MPGYISSSEVEAAFTNARTPQTKQVIVNGQKMQVISPFPSPADWRDHWIYFLLLDRFNNPQKPPCFSPFDGSHGVFQGGTFNGVREQLDYLRKLGVGAIWLSPIFKNCQYNPFTFHGYGIQDFLEVEPRFASNPKASHANPALAENELRALVDEAHARGIYVILDIVLNHTGDVFEYVLDNGSSANEADWRNDPYPIRWRDEQGQGKMNLASPPTRDAAVWPNELWRNEFFRRQGRGGENGGDFCSLKELVTAAGAPVYPVRNILIRAFQYFIAKFDIDGFRIDTLKYIEPEFAHVFGNAMREFALSIGKKNFITFGEVYDDEKKIACFIGRNAMNDGDLTGVDAALDFPLFFNLPAVAKGQCAPSAVASIFENRKQEQRGIISSHGEVSRYFVTFLDNHDQKNRFYFSTSDEPLRYMDQLTLGLGCLFTLQGIPCLY